MQETATGFWGPITSTVDWCETNYAHLSFVAELFNSVSSLAMVLAGVLGIVLHRHVLERRFMLAYAMVSVVGLGSVAFHATLLRGPQMMDELPMLWLVLVIVFILLENKPERRFGTWFPALLLCHAVLTTSLNAFTNGKLQFYLFHASFASMELFALGRVYFLHRRNQDRTIRRVYQLGMLSYALAISVWFTDLHACSTLNVTLPSLGIPNPQLHAWWHVLVSCGFYALLLVIAYDRLRTLGQDPQVRFTAGIIPIVRGASEP